MCDQHAQKMVARDHEKKQSTYDSRSRQKQNTAALCGRCPRYRKVVKTNSFKEININIFCNTRSTVVKNDIHSVRQQSRMAQKSAEKSFKTRLSKLSGIKKRSDFGRLEDISREMRLHEQSSIADTASLSFW